MNHCVSEVLHDACILPLNFINLRFFSFSSSALEFVDFLKILKEYL